MSHSQVYQVVVLGGGLNGLSTLYHLQRLGCRRLALVEQFQVGHQRGSSHGDTRVTRSAYHHSSYVEMMNVCNEISWPQLEQDAETSLIFPSSCVFFGPNHGPFQQYAEAVIQGGANVERIDRPTAQQRYPAFRFQETDGILDDHTAGVVAASDTIQALYRLTRRDGAEFFENTQVLSVEPEGDLFCLSTANQTIHTERLVITAGAWVTRLLPFLKAQTFVTRQSLLYANMVGEASAFSLGTFPIWAHLQEGPNPLHYSLPGFRGKGMKIARHVTEGRRDDPDIETLEGEPAAMEHLLQFVKDILHPQIESINTTETCLYTNTPTEDFILDLHPEHPRIAVGAGFSGHGFKFGPLTGRILAELVWHGKTTVPEFERNRQRFSIDSSYGQVAPK